MSRVFLRLLASAAFLCQLVALYQLVVMTPQTRTEPPRIADPTKVRDVPGGLASRVAADRARLVKETGDSEFPRAASVVDLSSIPVVVPKAPTLLADKDPYNSVRATVKPTSPPEAVTESATATPAKPVETTVQTEASPTKTTAEGVPVRKALAPDAVTPITPATQPTTARTPPAGAPIMKAIPVQPQQSTPVEIRKAVPVGPLDEEEDDSLLNKAATPPPAKVDE